MTRARRSALRVRGRAWLGGALVAAAAALASLVAQAEYGDVVLNRRSEANGMRPVVFQHWFHRIRFRCTVCHGEFGFRMRAGASEVSMQDITEGKLCGMCHDGRTAWGAEQCDLCHSGRRGMKTGVYGGHQTGGPGRW